MDTNELVRSLAADHGWRARPVGMVLAVALVVALPVTAAMFIMALGLRPDFMAATGRAFFILKFIVTAALALACLALALRLVQPGAPVRNASWLLAVPVGLLAAGIVADLALPQTSGWTARLIGSNARVCLTAIPLLSLPPLIALLIGLRRGAATRPMLTGALAGLGAGAIAATFYASHCADDSPLFVATWYTIAWALVALIGALAGRWVLRF
ncbi:DUF1109 domain-containing protein [Bradyrhizobium sp. LHD-71]|uniref:DUF1109 domain-containing protein n=1 Tax=Bradyrhizobium sp. LHD-71 TaxID=3072141 RepID=UPI00280FABD3|nr:DUF1109 domain-containing protein [Bradyrhizobium sp. LHD-71]MDQ8732573.1 DUF1109 domain-containing protein [Bradyrhizobium sp. LHD-71]